MQQVQKLSLQHVVSSYNFIILIYHFLPDKFISGVYSPDAEKVALARLYISLLLRRSRFKSLAESECVVCKSVVTIVASKQ
jgi:hypothetical protein